MAWKTFGKTKAQKSTKQLFKEMQKLEKAEKDATERSLIEARIAEIKHAKRNAILGKLKSVASSTYSGAYKAATSPQAKALSRKRIK